MKRIQASRTVIVVAVAGVVLAGCSSTAGPNGNGGDPNGKIEGEITFATFSTYFDQDLIDEFENEHPGTKVNLQFTANDAYAAKIQSQAATRRLPDILTISSTNQTALVQAGQLLDLRDALKTPASDSDGTWGKSFVPEVLASSSDDISPALVKNGQQFGFPVNTIAIAAVYNKSLYAKLGVKPPTTFDQLLDNCNTISAAGYIPMSLTGSIWGSWYMRLAWDQTLSTQSLKKFSTSSSEFEQGYALLEDMAKAHCWSDSQIATDIPGEQGLFLQQKSATIVTVPENFVQSLVRDATFDLDAFVLPPFAGKEPNRTVGGGNVMGISAKSKNPAVAIAFAKFLTSKKVSAELAQSQFTVPSVTDVPLADSPLMSVFADATSHGFIDGKPYMPSMTPEGFTKWNTDLIPGVVIGKYTAKEAAEMSADIFEK